MRLHSQRVARLRQDLQQLVVGQEVEPAECGNATAGHDKSHKSVAVPRTKALSETLDAKCSSLKVCLF